MPNTFDRDDWEDIRDERQAVALMERKAAAFDEIQKILFAYTDNEITAHPWWSIVRRGSFGRMIVLNGPFFSRERAEECRKARLYEYKEKSFVYCECGSRSAHYVALREAVQSVMK